VFDRLVCPWGIWQHDASHPARQALSDMCEIATPYIMLTSRLKLLATWAA